MLFDSTATCYGSYARGPYKADKVRKKNCCVTLYIIIYIIHVNSLNLNLSKIIKV